MSEHDIDKYFRTHLKDVEEPILPADFSEFEKMATKQRSWKWLYMLLILPLIGLSAYLINTHSSDTSLFEPLVKKNKTERSTEVFQLENDLDSNSNKGKSTSSNTSKKQTIASESALDNVPSQSVSNPALSADENYSASGAILNENESKTRQANTANKAEWEPSNLTPASISQNPENGDADMPSPAEALKVSTNSNGLNTTSTRNDVLENTGSDENKTSKETSDSKPRSSISKSSSNSSLGGVKAQAETNNPDSKSISQLERDETVDDSPFSRKRNSDSKMVTDFQKIELIGLSEIELKNIPHLNSDTEKSESPDLATWRIDAFAQFEINNELGGIPSAGFISSWQKNKWNLGIGLGIGQTGTLNWTQTRREINYGFDAYEENYQLETKNFTFISMPVHLAYRILPRSELFLGFAPEMVINASQAYRVSESNQNQSTGYLYKTGAPSILIFINAGYGFSISEKLKLDLGINYSPQKWKVTEVTPFGGFIRLKFNIR